MTPVITRWRSALGRLRARKEWQFFVALAEADRSGALLWAGVVLLRGILPGAFAVVMGLLVGAVHRGDDLMGPLIATGILFILLQVLGPVHQVMGANLGDRTAAWLYDRLTDACLEPRGMRHLEDPTLASDLTVARDFDLGQTGPPLSISMDFIANGLVQLIGGLSCLVVLAGYTWWAPLVLGSAWLATHWTLRESAIWLDRNTDEVRAAQHQAQYLYRLAVEAGPAKEVRLFGLAAWTLERFVAARTRLHDLQFHATRLRERPLFWSALWVTGANVVVCWALARAATRGDLDVAQIVTFAQSAVGVSMIAFGGLNWALDGASAPVTAVLRLGPAMAQRGTQVDGSRAAALHPAREIRFRNVTFAYGDSPVLSGFDLTIPAGSSLAIVGQNGAGKTTLAKLLCRFYDPASGSIEVDGIDLRELSVDAWRERLAAVFQDFIRFELSLRHNVAPRGTSDAIVRRALDAAGAADLAGLDTVLARGYEGGTDLSGGQWQRVALARVLCAVEAGAGVVILDEPTAQLDVRGEAEIFDRLLARTRRCTTILISHRFSTVRHADRICVLEQGRVAELGTHDELMTLGGRYRAMFDLQADRFTRPSEEGRWHDALA